MRFQINIAPEVSEDAQLVLKIVVPPDVGVSMDSVTSFSRRTSLALAVKILKARGIALPKEALDALA